MTTTVRPSPATAAAPACWRNAASARRACATNLLVVELASEIYNVERVIPRIEDESLLKILEDMNVSPICPHLVCMEQLAGTIGLRQGKGALR